MKYLRLILSNLKRKKLRTALTAASIMVAFLLFGFLAADQTSNEVQLLCGTTDSGADSERLVIADAAGCFCLAH